MGILFWPFKMIWALIGFLFRMMGRLLAVIVGLVFIFIGMALTLTLLGMFIGIPLIIFGALLIVRSLF